MTTKSPDDLSKYGLPGVTADEVNSSELPNNKNIFWRMVLKILPEIGSFNVSNKVKEVDELTARNAQALGDAKDALTRSKVNSTVNK